MKKKFPIVKALFIAWVVFASLYFIYGEYMRLTQYVAQNAYGKGYQDSIMQLLNEVSKCQPVPIPFGENKVDIIATSCLQQLPQPTEGVTEQP
jgi:hypothetical protein